MSRPIGMIGRATSSLSYRSSPKTLAMPAAIASRVLPVPAAPSSVISLTSSSSSRSSAIVCCTLRAMMPKVGFFCPVTGIRWSVSASRRPEPRVARVLDVVQQHELVGLGSCGSSGRSPRHRGLGERLDRQHPVGVELVDQRPRRVDLGVPRVQPVGVDLLVLEVLGLDPQRVALDARAQVLADEHRGVAPRASGRARPR
jgi:hypothetical protein